MFLLHGRVYLYIKVFLVMRDFCEPSLFSIHCLMIPSFSSRQLMLMTIWKKIVEVVKEVEFFRFLEVNITTDERMKTASMLDWRISSWTQLPDQLKTHNKKPVVWVPSLWVQMPTIILEKRRMHELRNGWTYLFYCLIQLPNTWPNACALVPEKPCDRFQVVVSRKVGHSRAYYLSHWWGALKNKKKDWYQ